MNKYEEDYKKELREKALAVPKETRQKVIDMFRHGKTIGEIRKEFDLELMTTAEIITMNIETVPILNQETI